MKILIGNTVLAGGVEAQESPYDVTVRNEREVQIVGVLRGDAAVSYDRGNQRTILSFRVTRRHNSTEDAQKFILMHATHLGNLSTSVTVIGEPSGDEYLLPNATVAGVQSSSFGSTSTHEYRIVGGNFSKIQAL
ncbi:MAG: hypothetical protein LBD33_02600 [Puniceicoccales bacterium]|jgi:hypothetical protein|nr:hypothetical protein [Puniceicoccales bacterium]